MLLLIFVVYYILFHFELLNLHSFFQVLYILLSLLIEFYFRRDIFSLLNFEYINLYYLLFLVFELFVLALKKFVLDEIFLVLLLLLFLLQCVFLIILFLLLFFFFFFFIPII